RRFTGDPLDMSVDELVRDQVANDDDSAAGEAVDEREQSLLALSVAAQRMDGSGNEHQVRPPIGDCRSEIATFRRIQLTAAIRLSTIASAASGSRGRASSVRP